MSILASATNQTTNTAQINVVCGENGVGKTTWSASHPNAIIADLERGAREVVKEVKTAMRVLHEVPGGKPEEKVTLAMVRSLISELRTSKHNYKTLVIDSAEALEGLILEFVCKEGKVDSIEKYEGGYGKGWTRTREIMREIMLDLQDLRDSCGITINIVAHTQTKSQTNPATNQTFDRVIMRCNDKMAAIIRDLADNVFFVTYQVHTTTENNKTKAFGDGKRLMYTQWRPGFDAKNRMGLPYEIEFDYEAFVDAQSVESDVSTLIEEVKAMSANAPENLQATIAQQIEKFKTNKPKLKEIKQRLMKYAAA